MASPADLDRRLSRRIECEKAIQLTAADLALLVESGAIATFRHFVEKHQRDQCRARNVRSRSINGGATPSTGERTGRTSKSSGMTMIESANEALAQVHQTLGKAGRH